MTGTNLATPATTAAPSPAQRFTEKVIKEFQTQTNAEVALSEYQKRLAQGYFIGIDRALKIAEENRVRKNENNKDHKYDNPLPVTWDNVNLSDLALDVVHYARMGLDMMQSNHLSPIPFKNNKTNKYDITLMPGYGGIQYTAEKYALEPPINTTIELVYSTDTFKPIKKSAANKVDSYEFEINNAFDRGTVKGGFGYIEYADPTKNKLIIMSLKDIEKRKPPYAAAEFWGGKTKKWENGKQVEVETDGWFEEMCLKTIKREVFGTKHILRDPKKIDDDYQHLLMRENDFAEIQARQEIDANANKEFLDIEAEVVEEKKPLPTPAPKTEAIDMETGEVLEAGF